MEKHKWRVRMARSVVDGCRRREGAHLLRAIRQRDQVRCGR
jgi:hypothetical protein